MDIYWVTCPHALSNPVHPITHGWVHHGLLLQILSLYLHVRLSPQSCAQSLSSLFSLLSYFPVSSKSQESFLAHSLFLIVFIMYIHIFLQIFILKIVKPTERIPPILIYSQWDLIILSNLAYSLYLFFLLYHLKGLKTSYYLCPKCFCMHLPRINAIYTIPILPSHLWKLTAIPLIIGFKFSSMLFSMIL